MAKILPPTRKSAFPKWRLRQLPEKPKRCVESWLQSRRQLFLVKLKTRTLLRMVPSFEVLRIECADYAGRPTDLAPGNSRSSRRILRSRRRRNSREDFRCGLFSRAPRSGCNFFDASHSKFSSKEPRSRLTDFGWLSRIHRFMSGFSSTRCQCCTCCCMCVSTGARGLLT